MEIYKTPIGVLVLEGGKVVDKKLFPRDPKKVAGKLGGECPEEAEMKAKHPKAVSGRGRLDLVSVAESLGIKKGELDSLIAKVNEEMAKKGVSEGFGRDKLIVNAVRAQRGIESNVNTECETLREWYSIHFPELNDLLKDNSDYAGVVAKIGSREKMRENELGGVLEDKRYARAIPQVAKESIGSKVDERDMQAICEYASSIIDASGEERALHAYIEKAMEEIAANVSSVATPYVGALLLEQAGSLEKLASLPASTIQVLGAQKAMFRFLKTHKLPPKYGVLYVHPLVSQAPKSQKGKLARTLASKISIAAKVDFYGGEYIGDRLKSEMEKRVKSLRE